MRGSHIHPGPPPEAALLRSASVLATVEMLTVGAWPVGSGSTAGWPGSPFMGILMWPGQAVGLGALEGTWTTAHLPRRDTLPCRARDA